MKLCTYSIRALLATITCTFATCVYAQSAPKKLVPGTPVNATSQVKKFANSKNAPSIVDVYEDIDSRMRAVKRDPFDPNAEQRQQQEILAKYTGRPIYVPAGEESRLEGQQLTSLIFNPSRQSLSIARFSKSGILAFGYMTDYRYNVCDGGGHSRIYGYTIETNLYELKSVTSDFGSVATKKVDGTWYEVTIDGIPTETARGLSGNIERYVTFDRVNNHSEMVSSGQSGGRCTGDDERTRRIGSRNFTFDFIDKTSGKSVLRIRVDG